MIIGGKSCHSCDFRYKQGNAIFCTRFPPQLFLATVQTPHGLQQVTQASYPIVNPTIPCGEYKRNEMHASEEITAKGNGITALPGLGAAN